MAKSNAQSCRDYQAKEAARNAALGVEKLTIEVSAGTKPQAKELIKWHGFGSLAELVQTLIRNAHAAGSEPNPLTTIPPSGFEPTEAQLAECQPYPGLHAVEDWKQCPPWLQKMAREAEGYLFLKWNGNGVQLWVLGPDDDKPRKVDDVEA